MAQKVTDTGNKYLPKNPNKPANKTKQTKTTKT